MIGGARRRRPVGPRRPRGWPAGPLWTEAPGTGRRRHRRSAALGSRRRLGSGRRHAPRALPASKSSRIACWFLGPRRRRLQVDAVPLRARGGLRLGHRLGRRRRLRFGRSRRLVGLVVVPNRLRSRPRDGGIAPSRRRRPWGAEPARAPGPAAPVESILQVRAAAGWSASAVVLKSPGRSRPRDGGTAQDRAP